jgi:lysophospholipase L1-like esterase
VHRDGRNDGNDCGGEHDGGEAAPATAALPAGARYIALGSSFAAGTGIPTQGPKPCGRSDHNYAHLVAAELQLDLVDVTCGGAFTANLIDTPEMDEPVQMDAITADTALVTMTVGGNDVAYTLSTIICAGVEECVPDLDTAATDTALADLPNRFTTIVQAIRDRAPDAIIVLVTYPEVIPADDLAAVARLRRTGCVPVGSRAASQPPRSSGQRHTSPTVGRRPARAVRPSTDSWVSSADEAKSDPFHPTAVGHEGMAQLVLALLQAA